MRDIPEINIRHFLIIALGGNQYLHPIIDEMYEERRLEYYEAYRNSGIPNDIIIPRHITKNEEKMKQVAGIVEWCYLHNDFESLMKLIKKGYKFSYQFVTQRKDVSLGDFELAYTKKKGGMEKTTDLDIMYASLIVIYLCHREKKPCSMNNEYGRLFIDAIQSMIFESIGKKMRFSDENKEKYKTEIDELFQKYGIKRNMPPTSMGKFFEMFVEKQTQDMLLRTPYRNMQEIRAEVFREGICKFIGSMSLWIRINGLNEMDLTDNTLLTKEDVENVFLDYILASQKDSNQLMSRDRDQYIVSLLFMQALANVYNETKRLYLDESQERHYLELKQAIERTETKSAELDRQEQSWSRERDEKNATISGLREELRRVERQLQQATTELEKREDHTKEVAAFRASMYEAQQEHVAQEEFPIQSMLNKLQEKKVAIFGGHPNWRMKLKEYLPNFQFIEVEAINRDLAFVDKLDAVFVNSEHFNHKFYERLMTRMNRNETALYYLKGNSNPEKNIKDIYQALR